MSVRAYVEVLGNIGPHRMAELCREKVAGIGGDQPLVTDFYVRLGPGYERNIEAWPECASFVRAAGGRMWGWGWCEADQAATARELLEYDRALLPDGWCLNIEKPLEGAPLGVLLSNMAGTRKPLVSSIAGTAPAVYFDWRALETYGSAVEWQCYVDSGEGQPPDVAVRELVKPSRIHFERRYRATVAGKLGWGELVDTETFAFYRTKGRYHIELEQSALWPPFVVKDRQLYDREDWTLRGALLGSVAYGNVRCALDTTRTAQQKRDLTGWVNLAASARIPGASKRGITVYLAEVTPDDVFQAIARGASS